MKSTLATLLLLGVLGVVAAHGQAGDSTDIPIGRGTLRQDAITLRLATASLEIRVVPIDQRVTRLLTPDAYQALQSLRASKKQAIDSIAGSRGVNWPGVALVSFHALAPATRFDPTLLTIGVHGQQLRPIGMVPLSAAFSNRQLDVRDLATGLLIFERPFPVTEDFTVTYLSTSSDGWGRKLEGLDAERARILSWGRARVDSGRE